MATFVPVAGAGMMGAFSAQYSLQVWRGAKETSRNVLMGSAELSFTKNGGKIAEERLADPLSRG